jgi:integrase
VSVVDRVAQDSFSWWIQRYQDLAVTGVRSKAVADKIALHLQRFLLFFQQSYGHDRISICLRRDVVAWQQALQTQGFSNATVNNYIASLSGFMTWVDAQASTPFANGKPTQGIGELGLPAPDPRALSEDQIRTLKNLCDRLPRFYELKGRRHSGKATHPINVRARPGRDRAIVFVLLSTGLRREELTQLNLDQIMPNTIEALQASHRAQIYRVRGKGKSERTVYLSADARTALANYLEFERPRDTNDSTTALFLSANEVRPRSQDGRLSPRAINQILEQIGRWHDAEIPDPGRHISPLRPHDLRHTFAFQLAKVTGSDAYELERRLGHRSQRYIQRYTNPQEAVAASYVEQF